MTSSLVLLLGISVVFVIGIGAAFWWAIFSGQFDDAGEAGRAVLLDDDSVQDATDEASASPPAASHAGRHGDDGSGAGEPD